MSAGDSPASRGTPWLVLCWLICLWFIFVNSSQVGMCLLGQGTGWILFWGCIGGGSARVDSGPLAFLGLGFWVLF